MAHHKHNHVNRNNFLKRVQKQVHVFSVKFAKNQTAKITTLIVALVLVFGGLGSLAFLNVNQNIEDALAKTLTPNSKEIRSVWSADKSNWKIENLGNRPNLWRVSDKKIRTFSLEYRNEKGNYDTGRSYLDGNAGSITSDFISLPATNSITLRFDHIFDVEADLLNKDIAMISVLEVNNAKTVVWKKSEINKPSTNRNQVKIDLTPFAGKKIKISASFDTFDAIENSGQGWIISNMEILANQNIDPTPTPTPTPTTYIPLNLSDSGASIISYSGAIVSCGGSNTNTESYATLNVPLVIKNLNSNTSVNFKIDSIILATLDQPDLSFELDVKSNPYINYTLKPLENASFIYHLKRSGSLPPIKNAKVIIHFTEGGKKITYVVSKVEVATNTAPSTSCIPTIPNKDSSTTNTDKLSL